MINFVSFLILTIVLTSMTIRSSRMQKDQIVQNTSNLCKDYIMAEIKDYYPRSTSLEKFVFENKNDLYGMINIISKNNERMIIFITDAEGTVLLSTDRMFEGKIEDSKIIEKIGSDDAFVMSTDLNGVLGKINVAHVSSIKQPSGETVGSLIICFERESIDNLTATTIKTIIFVSLGVMIASFVAVYFISERISAPLKQMRIATKNYSEGNFDQRIPVKGEDEVAELAKAFNSMADSLSDLEYMRSSFLANVSHDLRSPMTTISGFIDGILDGAIPPEKQSYYLGLIQQEVKRLSRLVTDLLDISRLESGTKKFDYSQFDITETARVILLTFETRIDAKKLDIEFNAPDDKLFVYSDKDAIYRVLYNLCDNAVKFSKDNGKYIITIKDEKEYVSVSVYNEGIGISVEDLPHVFDRFYKSDKSRGLDKSGTGLGLYIAKTITEALGGSIKAESEYNKYCRFTIRLKKQSGNDNQGVK
ncbi:MAG: HAMP domain-containing histidine kinase [Clostridiales bacterium]|nr:HAMP domain-containing histidine kinase [Clostridiales bacterium]